MKMPLNAAGLFRDRREWPRSRHLHLNCARRLHLHAAHGGFARKLEQACGARVLGVEAMTFCQRPGDNALQLSSLATVHESICEFPPLNDYSSR